ncbi:hypothetical protein RRG08_040676 [Elysia crispata]|uniref:Uncharacterized protein n=1 Tax=Elysia crispata TaxID=231223 RepID=A0AAE1D6I0_9GAST|nr:hypothetical protein RRG08_040676 [Elysia crispata]
MLSPPLRQYKYFTNLKKSRPNRHGEIFNSTQTRQMFNSTETRSNVQQYKDTVKCSTVHRHGQMFNSTQTRSNVQQYTDTVKCSTVQRHG